MARLELHSAPAVGFEAPFEMLAACHERVQRMLALLQRLADHLAAQGADAQAAGAARDVMRYFDIAGPAHHQDEETHVLPRLRAAGEAALADRLHADHLRMHSLWQTVRAALLGVTASEWPSDSGQAQALQAPWFEFAALYDAHIALEESRAFPTARTQCDASALDAMGREMAGRRQAARPA
jgi:hemerythrin-like domain-containing protein